MFKILIIGSGFVGQATGKSLAKIGNEVFFCDTDNNKLEELESEGYRTIMPDDLELYPADIVFITVPTPTVNNMISLDSIYSAAKNLSENLLRHAKNRPLIVVKSTVPPGTTEKIITPMLEKYSGKEVGRDFDTAMNPEYLRERFAIEDFENPRLILIGASNEHARRKLHDLYMPYKDKCPIAFLSPTGAEMQKYVHNLWNAAKISYFNEMRAVANRLDLDADTIFDLTMKSAEATWNPKYGTKNFGPFGGSCLPKDTSAFLRWSKKELKMNLPLLGSVISVNNDLVQKNEMEAQKNSHYFSKIKSLSPIMYIESGKAARKQT